MYSFEEMVQIYSKANGNHYEARKMYIKVENWTTLDIPNIVPKLILLFESHLTTVRKYNYLYY